MFLMIGALFIVSENNLALKDSGNIEKLGNLYFSWIGNLFQNSGQVMGYAVKMNWLPDKNQSG